MSVPQEPRIVRREAFDVVGIEGRTSKTNNRIPELWETFGPREDDIDHREDLDISYGICFMDNDHGDEKNEGGDREFTAFVGVEVSKIGEIPEGMVHKAVPAAEYVVFTHKGPFFPTGLQQTYDYIYREWFVKNSQHKPTSNFDIEYYDHNRFRGIHHPETQIEIWVPIKTG